MGSQVRFSLFYIQRLRLTELFQVATTLPLHLEHIASPSSPSHLSWEHVGSQDACFEGTEWDACEIAYATWTTS